MVIRSEQDLRFNTRRSSRQGVGYRTGSAEELWRDLNSPPGIPSEQVPQPGSPQPPTR
jgi:hypothetical protein